MRCFAGILILSWACALGFSPVPFTNDLFAATPPLVGRLHLPSLCSIASNEGPSDVDTANPVANGASPYELKEMKSKIFSMCAACDRGFGASSSDRTAVEELLMSIAAFNPTVNATLGVMEGSSSAPLKKLWRLVYTSASDVSSLGASPLAAVGGIYQDARSLPVIMNVIDLKPRALQNLPPDFGSSIETTTRLEVKTRARPRPGSANRVGLTFESVEVMPVKVLGFDPPEFLPPLKLQFPQLGLDLQRQVFNVPADVDPRDSEKNPGYFDVVYVDEDFLVIKQGSPGGMFAAVSVDEIG